MGTNLRELSESYLMNTNMRGFMVFKNRGILKLWIKVALRGKIELIHLSSQQPKAAWQFR